MPSCHPRRLLAPTRRRPSGRTAAARSLLPTPPLPAQSPKRSVRRLRASGAEPTTLQPRGGREPACRAPLVRDQSLVSSFPHCSAAVRRRRPRGGRLPGRPGGGGRRPPALPASLGLRLCRPPPRARPAPVLNGHRAAPAVSDVPSPAQGRGCGAAARRAPLTPPARPSPSRRRRASGGCSRGPPGDQRGEDTRFAGSRARAL